MSQSIFIYSQTLCVYSQLAEVGVTGFKSEAGFYFMPDFEILRNDLKKRGIHDGEAMTAAILEETNVAVSFLLFYFIYNNYF